MNAGGGEDEIELVTVRVRKNNEAARRTTEDVTYMHGKDCIFCAYHLVLQTLQGSFLSLDWTFCMLPHVNIT